MGRVFFAARRQSEMFSYPSAVSAHVWRSGTSPVKPIIVSFRLWPMQNASTSDEERVLHLHSHHAIRSETMWAWLFAPSCGWGVWVSWSIEDQFSIHSMRFSTKQHDANGLVWTVRTITPSPWEDHNQWMHKWLNDKRVWFAVLAGGYVFVRRWRRRWKSTFYSKQKWMYASLRASAHRRWAAWPGVDLSLHNRCIYMQPQHGFRI